MKSPNQSPWVSSCLGFKLGRYSSSIKSLEEEPSGEASSVVIDSTSTTLSLGGVGEDLSSKGQSNKTNCKSKRKVSLDVTAVLETPPNPHGIGTAPPMLILYHKLLHRILLIMLDHSEYNRLISVDRERKNALVIGLSSLAALGSKEESKGDKGNIKGTRKAASNDVATMLQYADGPISLMRSLCDKLSSQALSIQLGVAESERLFDSFREDVETLLVDLEYIKDWYRRQEVDDASSKIRSNFDQLLSTVLPFQCELAIYNRLAEINRQEGKELILKTQNAIRKVEERYGMVMKLTGCYRS